MKNLFPVLGVSLVLFVAGCNTPGAGGLKDCGMDAQCFEESAAKCEGARVKIDSSQQPGASTRGPAIVMLAEIRGGTLDACKFYMKFDDFKWPAGYTPTQEDLLGVSLIKGKDMECTLPVNQISPTGSGSIGGQPDFDINKCTGTLVDLFKGIGGGLGGGYTP